jgi:hypothetical protein
MLAPPDSQKAWSPLEAPSRWWRDWSGDGSASELRCCGDEEIARMAKDASVSAGEFRKLAHKGSEGAELLFHRLQALDLDPKEVGRTERRTLQDLERVCAMCGGHRRCARDLARDSEDPVWEDYCPNATTLNALNKMPWSSRREW